MSVLWAYRQMQIWTKVISRSLEYKDFEFSRCIHIHRRGVKPPELNSRGYPLRKSTNRWYFVFERLAICSQIRGVVHIIWIMGFAVSATLANLITRSWPSSMEPRTPPSMFQVLHTWLCCNAIALELGANTASPYDASPMQHAMPPPGFFTPMTMGLQMTHYPYMSQGPFFAPPISVGLMPWFCTYPQMPTVRTGVLDVGWWCCVVWLLANSRGMCSAQSPTWFRRWCWRGEV